MPLSDAPLNAELIYLGSEKKLWNCETTSPITRLQMETQTSITKNLSSEAVFVRETIESNLLEGIIEIPNKLRNRLVEVILLPVVNEKHNGQSNKKRSSPLKRFAGAWFGEQLVRENQGNSEVREELS